MTTTACVKCGDPSATETRIFRVPYGEPWMLAFGLLSYSLMRKVHEVDAFSANGAGNGIASRVLLGPLLQ